MNGEITWTRQKTRKRKEIKRIIDHMDHRGEPHKGNSLELNNWISCEFPQRQLPPDIPKITEWILDYYKKGVSKTKIKNMRGEITL